MKTFGTNYLIGAAFLLAIGPVAAQEVQAGSGALTSGADALRAHGISLSEPSLIAALGNADPEIRELAAFKLAEDHDLDAVPYLEFALSVEDVPEAAVDIADALLSLHDPKGLEYLQETCIDAPQPINLIVRIAQFLDMGGESTAACADAILNFLDAHTDPAWRFQVSPVLPDLYRWASPAQAGHMTRILQNMLADPSAEVRILAGDQFLRIGLLSPANALSSANALREAAAKEKNPLVKAKLQDFLNQIEKKR